MIKHTPYTHYMKNIYLSRVLVSIFGGLFTGLLIPAPVSGESLPFLSFNGKSSYAISVTPSFGLLYGQAEEIVYESPDNDTMLSQLLWDMKPLLFIGTNLTLERRNLQENPGFFFDLALKFGFHNTTGVMEDRDWLAANNGLSHFSSHVNETQDALLVDISTGVSLPSQRGPVIKVFFTGSYMHFKWAARDGYTQYGIPWNESLPKTALWGPAIDYSQDWYALSVGASADISLSRFLSLEPSIQVSPLIKANAQDDHLMAKVQYNDYMSGGILIEPRGVFRFLPRERFALSLSVGYRFISGVRGDSQWKYSGSGVNGTVYKTPMSAGAGYSALDTGLSVKITL
jgi:outer membrane protease